MAKESQPRNAFYMVAAIFLALASGIGGAGYLYFESNRREIMQHTLDELSAIAELKTNEISRWRKERLGHARVIVKNPLLASEVERWLNYPDQSHRIEETLSWMQAIKDHLDYGSVFLLDVEGRVRLSVPEDGSIDPDLVQSLSRVVNSKEILFFDLYRSEKAGGIRCDLLVPIFDKREPGSPVTGVLLLEIDPYRFLYPLIQNWPTPSPTSETLLVRKDGAEVVYLNELRHQKGTALSLRSSITDEDLPAAMSIRGKEGLTEGIDYRGVPVLASLRAIQDSPWYLVAKVDEREVYAPIVSHAGWVAFVVAMLIAAAGVSISFLWTRHYARLGRREQEALKKAHQKLEQRVLERTAELWESRERFRHIAENIREVFYVTNADLTEMLYISPAYEETWGRTRESLYENHRSWFDAIHPLDRDKVERTMKEEGSKGHSIDYRIIRPDRSIRWIWDRGFPVHDASGEIYRYTGIAEDITERKQAEDTLRLDEARFEALYELGQMTERSTREIADFALEKQVSLTGSEIGFLGFMNEDETVLIMHAWSEKVMERCKIKDNPVHFPVEGAGLWAEVIRERQPVIINDYLAFHPGKKGYPEGHIALRRFMSVPVMEGSRIMAVAAVANKREEYDAADARQLSLFLDGVWKLVQRRKAEKALREAERLASMGRALSGVAHDMKTPLVAIGGFSRLVRDHLEESHPGRAKLGIVIKETGRLENLVKDMLDFSKPLELSRSSEDIGNVIAESLAILEDTAKQKHVALDRRSHPSPVWISLDVMRIKQVIVNLVMNAIEASPEGETVTVQSYDGDSGIVIEVIDHGPGIPKEKRDEVFSPFYTTRKAGTGLGLPIVRKIIEAHKGHIKILDNPERGLTFRVEIPNLELEQG